MSWCAPFFVDSEVFVLLYLIKLRAKQFTEKRHNWAAKRKGSKK